MPFLVSLAVIFACDLGKNKEIMKIIGAVPIIILFCVMNMNKVPQNDWIWYLDHYDLLAQIGYFDYIGSTQGGGLYIKPNEPVYYFISYVISNLTSANRGVLAFSITIIDYLCVVISVNLISKKAFVTAIDDKYSKYVSPSVMLTVAVTLFTLNFALTAHLVRQVMAASFVLLGYALSLNKKTTLGMCFNILGLLTHQTVFIMFVVLNVPVIVSFVLRSRPIIKYFMLIVAVPVALYILARTIGENQIYLGGTKDDGSVSSLIIGLDVLIFCVLAIVTVVYKYNRSIGVFAIFGYFYIFIVLYVLRDNPLASLRLYFYIDFIRGVALVFISSKLLSSAKAGVTLSFNIALFALAVLYTDLRIAASPFDYGLGFAEYLAYPI